MTGETRAAGRAGDLVLRPATFDDAAFAADLYTAVLPDDPQDPQQTEYWWRHPHAGRITERFVGTLDGALIAFAFHRHDDWSRTTERYGTIGGDLLPAYRTASHLDALHAAMEERSHAAGARTFTAWAWEHDRLHLDVVTARSYREERRERYWALNLVAEREALERMARASRARMREQGIDVRTIDRDGDPEKWHKLWRMSEEAGADVPSTIPYVESTLDEFVQGMHEPGIREDRIWIAREGDTILGVSILSYPPSRGVVQTDWTGVARAARGKGVARALKCETVMQAIALGVQEVRTDNDSTNAPILHLNEVMGYRRRPDRVQLMRSGF